MIELYLLTFIVATSLLDQTASQGPSFIEMHLYQHGNCGGWDHAANLENVCYHFPKLENEISGFKVARGSCVKLHKGGRFCEPETKIFGYPNLDFCTLPCCGWNDKIKSVSTCSTRSVRTVCPSGSFVREMRHGSPQDGISISCFETTKSVANATLQTHGGRISYPVLTRCPVAAFGMSAAWDDKHRIYYNSELSCKRPEIGVALEPGMETIEIEKRFELNCPERLEALVGLEVVLDETDVVKEISSVCQKVPNPALMCEPLERLATVVSCDNRLSGNVLRCTYSRTVGVGVSKSLSETERKEHEFSTELGYSISVGIKDLSASMSASLGQSELTGYEWTKEDTNTWQEEVTVSAEIEVRPYTWSELRQLIGKCSFFGVQANYFQQVDRNVTGHITMIQPFVI